MQQKVESFNLYAKVYIFLVIVSCVPILFYAFDWFKMPRIVEFIFWLVLLIFFEYKPVAFFSHGNEESVITVTSTVILTTVIVLGIQGALLVTILGTLIVEILLKKPYYKVLFNASQYGLTVFISGWIFFIFKQSPDHITIDFVSDAIALIALVISHYLVNSTLVSLVLSFASHMSFVNVFLYDFKMTMIHHTVSSTIALAMATIYNPRYPYVVLLFIPPLFLIDQAFRWYYDLHRAASRTIKALADIIDRRDQYTAEHSTRVTEYAKHIATHMKLSELDTESIIVAASVHDLGKIGIADNIINKEDFLTDEEYSQVKKHPEIAYELIKNLKPYEKSAAYVLHHHEWLNGSGYPKGLKNDEIPLGARIVAVADAYDAMTTHRPYRRAYTTQEAIAELKRCSGSQFDPNVAEVLITILKESEEQ